MAEMTIEQFEAAEARGRARLKGPRAESAYYDVDRDRVIVQLTTGIELGFAPTAVEGLENASTEDLKTIEIADFGLGIHFPTVDADLFVPALLEGVRGSRRWMAAQLDAAGGPGKTARSDPAISGRRSSVRRTETTVAVFDTAAHTQAAVADLVAQGIPASSIEHYGRSVESASQSAGGTAAAAPRHRGLWAWLTESETTSDHNAFYDKTIETGGIVVTVISDDSQAMRIHTILEAHNPIDIDERHSQYSASGAYGAAAASGVADSAKVLTLSAESLQVGKRAVDKGITRVRRYVVERPVEEQIRLRDETVTVFRRRVTAGLKVGSDAFTDRVITVQETAEEAVVAKSAQVVEEVVVQKDVAERVETVRDSLRHEEVEIGGPIVRDGPRDDPRREQDFRSSRFLDKTSP